MEQSQIVPVAGDFAAIDSLPEQGILVPVKGVVIKISLLSSDRGSIPGFNSSYKYLMTSPFEPIYFFAQSICSGSACTIPALKLILNKLF
ncbi:hypothetical protein SDC9_151468 [bioreactor metagenome]|uniref:Uncharacterized protein n=1 Tax=bioreactor metagenome TaxID=1076179 RepID=A0A645ESG7_9ZZZZ